MKDFLELCCEKYSKSHNGKLEIIRDDGNISIEDLHKWIDQNYEICEKDREFLGQIHGNSALDIGCGTGVHLRWLQQRLNQVYGIDISEWAIKKGEELGSKNLVTVSLWEFNPEMQFDNILCMNGTIGIIGSVNYLGRFFRKISALLSEGGKLYIQGVDWRVDSTGKHRDYLQKNIENDVYPGQVYLKQRYEGYESEEFPWVWIDTDTLWQIAKEYGFRMISLTYDQAKYYVVLQKKSTSILNQSVGHFEEEWWVIGDDRKYATGNFHSAACGMYSENNIRVEQFGPYILSFLTQDQIEERMTLTEIRKKFIPLRNLLGYPIMIGGSHSPLSKKAPNASSDIDIYVVTPILTYQNVLMLQEKIKQYVDGISDSKRYSVSIVQNDWINLPYFYEAVSVEEEQWWNMTFEEIQKEIIQRDKASKLYIQNINVRNVVADINNIYGLSLDETDIVRIIAIPRWKSINDCFFSRIESHEKI